MHPDQSIIETHLDNGTPFRNIAAQHRVSSSALFRHKAHASESPKALDTESGAMLPESPELTLKMRKFCLAFAGEAGGNGTQAARLAEYQGNDVTLAAVASENLRKPQIQAFIAQLRASAERAASDKILSATETLVGITRIAESDIADMFPDDPFLQEAKQRGVSRLIKSINFDKRSGRVVKLEMYSAQAGFQDLGKHYKLFSEKIEIETPQKQEQVVDELKAVAREIEQRYSVKSERVNEIMHEAYPELWPAADITSDTVS